jgi:hypothetical protein
MSASFPTVDGECVVSKDGVELRFVRRGLTALIYRWFPARPSLTIPRAQILAVTPQPPQARIQRGQFVVTCRVLPGSNDTTQVNIAVRGGDKKGSAYRRGEQAFAEQGLLYAECGECGQPLTPAQEKCGECGKERG